MKRIAFFGGSFDPVHNAHLRIAQKLPELFVLDEFNFVPAFHAPHKPDQEPLSAYHRFAMLALATEEEPLARVSTLELDRPEKPYTIETVERLLDIFGADTRLFFVIGADSWRDITAWREWEKLLLIANFIVVERPGIGIDFSHVTPEIKEKVADLRGKSELEIIVNAADITKEKIYFTDAVKLDISATEIRNKIRENSHDWQADVPPEVVKYIEKYQIYK
jgi:nicotinate-nucleotide adenylyltransferase